MKMAPCPATGGSWQVLEVLGDGGSFKKGLPPKKHFHRNCIDGCAVLDAAHYESTKTISKYRKDPSGIMQYAGIGLAHISMTFTSVTRSFPWKFMFAKAPRNRASLRSQDRLDHACEITRAYGQHLIIEIKGRVMKGGGILAISNEGKDSGNPLQEIREVFTAHDGG
jgi:hypothetical protein